MRNAAGLSIARYLVGLVERGGPEEIAGPALVLDAGEQRELAGGGAGDPQR